MDTVMKCYFAALGFLSHRCHGSHGSHGSRNAKTEGDYHPITGWWFGPFFIFPYIGNNHPNWLIFFWGVQTTNQISTRGLDTHHEGFLMMDDQTQLIPCLLSLLASTIPTIQTWLANSLIIPWNINHEKSYHLFPSKNIDILVIIPL